MTQITVATTSDAVPFTTAIPRPREAAPPTTHDPPRASEAPLVLGGSVAPPATSLRQVGGLALALDSVLALALAITTAAVGMLPVDVAVAAATAWPLLLLASGHYRRRAFGESRLTRTGLVLRTGLHAAVLALAVSAWLTSIDRFALAELVAAFTAASVCYQLGVRRHRPRLVLAGRPRDVREAMLELERANSHEIVAACLTRASRVPFGDLPTYIGLDGSSGVAHRHQADAFVVLPGARLTSAEVRRLHWGLAGVGTELCVGTGLLDVTPDRTRVFASGGLNLVHVAPASLRGPRRWVKDVLERAAATIGLALLLPALLVVGLLIRLGSPGPAIYRQHRVGRDGRLFTMYKFRTMSTSAEAERTELVPCNEADGVLFKIKQDPRITGFGRWLRRTSIDEVPQLWNVIRGDMSLVGPRPALPDEVARYDTDPLRRLVVKPGITGLWQVSGRSELSWPESVRLDVRYVDNWSLGLDLAILARTVKAVLGRRGAY